MLTSSPDGDGSSSENLSEEKLSIDGGSIAIGGQAVIEGVMLRGKKNWVLGVRCPDESISVEVRPLNSLLERAPLFRLPLIRGVVVLIESMVIGMKSLLLSTQTAAGEEEKLSTKEIILSLLFGLGFFIIFFKLLPALFVVSLYGPISSDIIINAIEGIAKIGLFVGYIWMISRVPDIARVFEYHGAEHKVIHAYEDEQRALSVDSAEGHSPIHNRCGTSFMLLVFVISVVVFTFLGRPPALQRVLLHIAIIPLVAGLSYEVIKLAGRHPRSLLLRIITGPGLLLQRLTTRPPDRSQIEVAMAALEKLMHVEGIKPKGPAAGDGAPEVRAQAPA